VSNSVAIQENVVEEEVAKDRTWEFLDQSVPIVDIDEDEPDDALDQMVQHETQL
jgi:hypothetical protein